MNLGVLRSFVFAFFNFDKLKSVIEFNNWARSSLTTTGCVGRGGGAWGIFGTSILDIVFVDKDLFGIECWRFSTKRKEIYYQEFKNLIIIHQPKKIYLNFYRAVRSRLVNENKSYPNR